MPTSSTQLEWCDVQFDDDSHWWVNSFNPSARWEFDQLGILDPRQLQHMLELLASLREYGLQEDIVDKAFFKFRLDDEPEDGKFRLERVRTTIYEDNDYALFALPDDMDEERGPYEDFMKHILRVRVRMLNNLIDNDQPLTLEEVDAEIREALSSDDSDDVDPHYFEEITAVLEYTPEGTDSDDLQALEDGLEEQAVDSDIDEGFEEISEDDEAFRQDKEALNWDDQEEEERRKRANPEFRELAEEVAESEPPPAKPKRGRPRKND